MKFVADDSGSVLVEVAVALPLLLLILVEAANYGLLLQQQSRLQNAASAAATFVSVPGNTNNLAGAQQVAIAAMAGLSGAQATAQQYWSCAPGAAHVASTTQCTGPYTPMQWVQVDVYATGSLLFPISGLPGVNTLHVTATERVQWIP